MPMIIPPQFTANTLSKHGGYGGSYVNPSASVPARFDPANFNPKKNLQVKPQLQVQ
jgi:hypothetical protein